MILCHECEKPLEGHDDAGCRRRMSRRYFMGAVVGAAFAARAAAAKQAELERSDGDTRLEGYVAYKNAKLRWIESKHPAFGNWLLLVDETGVVEDIADGLVLHKVEYLYPRARNVGPVIAITGPKGEVTTNEPNSD